MSKQIGKSGTGIVNKSGTGIHRSGTGIWRSGTGARLPALLAAAGFVAALGMGQALAGGDNLLVSEKGDNLVVSLHTDNGVYAGSTPLAAGEAGYFQVGLQNVFELSQPGEGATPLVKASGSGDAGESAGAAGGSLAVKASGSGASGESVGLPGGSLTVKASGSGDAGEGACSDLPGLLVKASGSGDAGESATSPGGSLMVKASGSGNSGESVDTPGHSVDVKASGSGNSGESNGGCGVNGFDLIAEVVIDSDGAHVLIHDRQGNEQLVGFVAAAHNNAPDDRRGTTRGFVATP